MGVARLVRAGVLISSIMIYYGEDRRAIWKYYARGAMVFSG